MDSDARLILNLTRGSVVCEQVMIADRALRRMRGLLGRQSLPQSEGMLLQPAPSIHTAFMRFPIDVVLTDGTLRVLKIVEQLPAWRAASAHRARAVLELASGQARHRGLEVGDQLGVVEVSDRLGAVGGGFHLDGVRRAGPVTDSEESETDCIVPPTPLSLTPAADAGEATRVLIIGNDRRFRSVAAVLLTRRGCAVTLGAPTTDLAGLIHRARANVVVLEISGSLTATAREAARIETLDPPVGVVIVGEEPDKGLAAMPVLPKWGSFDDLWWAIEDAQPTSTSWRSVDGRR